MKKIITLEQERNLTKDFDPKIRALKLISAAGKLSRSIAMREDCRNDVGNCIVNILILSVINDYGIEEFLAASNLSNIDENHDSVSSYMYELWGALGLLSTAITEGNDYRSTLDDMVIILSGIARFSSYSLEECADIAYNNSQGLS
ncbi:hypothetical protein [Nitrosomonas supralitoralis]|uniref:Uncharacterized protein n=1 Tax=Nitrosomonas supralitoralis TaxID=2116706 RepID=A0A2P7NS03_9PROT|nr:hypothetical protein [Nitrosomonas supralitoralis]PSJ16261.1 hypothetical protein C7H79_14380 [Nitrosomonas supralitoralis]